MTFSNALSTKISVAAYYTNNAIDFQEFFYKYKNNQRNQIHDIVESLLPLGIAGCRLVNKWKNQIAYLLYTLHHPTQSLLLIFQLSAREAISFT